MFFLFGAVAIIAFMVGMGFCVARKEYKKAIMAFVWLVVWLLVETIFFIPVLLTGFSHGGGVAGGEIMVLVMFVVSLTGTGLYCCYINSIIFKHNNLKEQ